MGKNEWANAMIKENPYFVEGMTPEEYDKEREYYLTKTSHTNKVC